jgi:hypothetical protein
MNRTIPLLVVAFALGASSVLAADTRVVLCFPGGPGSTTDAQPTVDRFLARLDKEMGWKSSKGKYFNSMAACRNAYKDLAPTMVMVPLHVYLSTRAAWKLTPVAILQNKETSGQFHILTKNAACQNCLTGATVSTGLQVSDRFLSKVAFDGKVAVGKSFTVKRTRSPMRAIKLVVNGKAIAVIVDDVVKRSLEGLPLAQGLRAIVTGPQLPGAVVATVGKAPRKLAAVLTGLCKADRALCKEMRITRFGNVDPARLLALEKKLK